jgi:hypothetical protein
MMLTEKNIPTDPKKWAYYKSQAKKKFDVYPSAYANAWAAKKYKAAGGGWRKDEGEEVEEGTTTASGGGEYQTPNAFAGSKSKWKKRVPKGYSEPSLYYEGVLNQVQDLLNEISYNDFKSDASSTHKQKINNSIKEISTQLYKMEQTLNQISKLKTEINGDQRIFYKSTFSKFGKISERILRLGNKIRELSK